MNLPRFAITHRSIVVAFVAVIMTVGMIPEKSMVEISIIKVTAADAVNETEQVWDDVRAKVDAARALLPISAAPPFVNSDFGDVYEIVFALHQIPQAEPTCSRPTRRASSRSSPSASRRRLNSRDPRTCVPFPLPENAHTGHGAKSTWRMGLETDSRRPR